MYYSECLIFVLTIVLLGFSHRLSSGFLLFLEIVVIASVVVWLLSFLAAFLSLGDFKNYSVFLVLVFFILPSLFDILVYAFLYKTLKKRNQTTLLRKVISYCFLSAQFFLLSLKGQLHNSRHYYYIQLLFSFRVWSNSSNTTLRTLPAFPSPRVFEKASLRRVPGSAGKCR